MPTVAPDLAFAVLLAASGLVWFAVALRNSSTPTRKADMQPTAIAKLIHVLYTIAIDPAFRSDVLKFVAAAEAIALDLSKAGAGTQPALPPIVPPPPPPPHPPPPPPPPR